MAKNLSTFNSNSTWALLPGGALIAAGLVAVIEVMVALFWPVRVTYQFLPTDRVPSVEESVIYFKMEHIARLPNSPDILFLGDSACLMNVVPSVIENQTGLKAYNLGTIEWLMPQGHLDLLKIYLGSHPPPQMLVYVISPLSVQADHFHYGFYDHFQRAYQPSAQLETETNFTGPSWRLRADLPNPMDTASRQAYLTTRRGQFAGHTGMGQLLWQQQGYLPDPTSPAILRDPDWPSTPPPLTITAAWAEGLTALMDFAHAHDIPFYLRFSPLPFAEVSPGPTNSTPLTTWLDSLPVGASPSVQVGQPLLISYPPGLFTNELHLTPQGAELFSTQLAAEIFP
ncbi:MAG: hypothetical protein Kow0031_02810 [Anaerolineae bacterium]